MTPRSRPGLIRAGLAAVLFLAACYGAGLIAFGLGA